MNYLFLFYTSKFLINSTPQILTIFVDCVLWLIIYEILFYHCHKLFHSKYFYKFHKIHHEYNEPYIICTEYTHPVEQLILIVTLPSIGMIQLIQKILITEIFN